MVVSLFSLRNSAANFVFFDIQHQSSNSFSHGFTFLSKHRAFKNIFLFHVFYQKHISASLGSSVPSAEFIGWEHVEMWASASLLTHGILAKGQRVADEAVPWRLQAVQVGIKCAKQFFIMLLPPFFFFCSPLHSALPGWGRKACSQTTYFCLMPSPESPTYAFLICAAVYVNCLLLHARQLG